MAKKKGKSVSFDAMVKFFMHSYSIPTKRDIEGIVARLDRIERLITASAGSRGKRGGNSDAALRTSEATASGTVLDVLRRYPDGVDFAQIKLETGFGEKKLRNILFRLHKLEKIQRKSRGIYVPAG
jgi:hypothetical protein